MSKPINPDFDFFFVGGLRADSADILQLYSELTAYIEYRVDELCGKNTQAMSDLSIAQAALVQSCFFVVRAMSHAEKHRRVTREGRSYRKAPSEP